MLSDLLRILGLLQGRSGDDATREVLLTTIYLSSKAPNWAPKTEADLQAAIDEGLIGESTYFDAKKELQTKGDNREFARDMASFANDGGTLIVGIAEVKAERRFFLEKQPLDGLDEKVNRISRTIPDPPLDIVTYEIPSQADPTMGYLVVHVPASPQAPHMVDGKYFGRKNTTKDYLRDPEVAHLHARRAASEINAISLLHDEMVRDPLRSHSSRQSHLFFVAQPLGRRRDMLLSLTNGDGSSGLDGGGASRKLIRFVHDSLRSAPFSTYPGLLHCNDAYRRARGAAVSTRNLGNGRLFKPESERDHNIIELQVFEDGGLRLYYSRLSDEVVSIGEHIVQDDDAVHLTRQFLAIVRAAAEYAEHSGNWVLAMGANRLMGRPSKSGMGRFGDVGSRYDQHEYEQATSASLLELQRTPGVVANRLVSPLLRSFGTASKFAELLSEPEEIEA